MAIPTPIVGLIVQFKINNAESRDYYKIQNENCNVISDPRLIPTGIYTMGNEYVAPSGARNFFHFIPRLIPTGIYTAGYEYNSLPGIRIPLLNVKMD